MGYNYRIPTPETQYYITCDPCGADSDEDDRYRSPQREYAESQGWRFVERRIPGLMIMILCPACAEREAGVALGGG